MKNIIGALIVLWFAGCNVSIEQPDYCVLEGLYETGSSSTPECGETQVFRQNIFRKILRCERHTITPNEESLTVCEPGDPSSGCDGFINMANGCSYNVWVRRVQ